MLNFRNSERLAVSPSTKQQRKPS